MIFKKILTHFLHNPDYFYSIDFRHLNQYSQNGSIIEFPKINFSEWTKWCDREYMNQIDRVGVYLLSHYQTNFCYKVEKIVKNIIYIGITGGKRYYKGEASLRNRLNAFDNVAFKGHKKGHSGAISYRNNFPTKKGNDLFVSIFPISTLDLVLQPLYLLYIERKSILEYAIKFGSPPICNSE